MRPPPGNFQFETFGLVCPPGFPVSPPASAHFSPPSVRPPSGKSDAFNILFEMQIYGRKLFGVYGGVSNLSWLK